MQTHRRTSDIFREDTRTGALSLHGHAVLLALVVALVFVLSELTLAAQGRYWTGGTAWQWAEAALGLALYTGVVWAGTEMLALLVSRFWKAPEHTDLLVLASAVLVGVALRWIVLWQGGWSLGGHWGMFAVLLLGTAACLALRVLTLVPVLEFCGVSIAALISAIVLTPMVTHLVLASPQRGSLSAAIPWGWAVVVAAGGAVLAALARRTEGLGAVRVLGLGILAAALPLALKIAPWFVPEARSPSRNNLVVITADSLRADMCSAYGGDIPTPALEELASRGVLFRQFQAPAPWTVPSLCAMFSSKCPPGLTPGAGEEQRELEELSYHKLGPYFLDDDGKTFVERLQYEGGYKTGAYIGNLAILYQDWLLKGFEERLFLDTLSYSVRGRFDLLPGLQAALANVYPPLVRERTMDSTQALVDYARDYIARHRNKDFFLWVHLMDPHTPYDPPQTYRHGPGDERTAWQEFPPHPAEDRVELAENMTGAEIRTARDLYAGEVRYVDHALGQVLHALEKVGIEDRTYVCFAADHGEEVFERGRYGHGYSMYGEVLRVPLVIAGPNIGQRSVDTPVSGLDLVPTFAGLLKDTTRPEWRGRSLVPLIRGESLDSVPVYAQATHHFRYRPEPMQTVIEWPWKLIRGLESGRKELYHLADDPGETRDAAQTQAGKAAELTAMLAEWSGTFPISFEQYTAQSAGQLGEVPSDLREIFENQGYLGTPEAPPKEGD